MPNCLTGICRDPAKPNPSCLSCGSKGQRKVKGDKRLERSVGIGRKNQLKPGAPPKRTKGVRQVSDKQEVRNAYLAGVKAERISHALLTEGKASCSRCPRSFTTNGSAHKGLDLHHTERRSGGRGYRPGDAGVDAPAKVELLCRDCHRLAEDSDPKWSKAS